MARGNRATVANDKRVGPDMVKDRRHALFKQWQPMVHARQPAAFRDGLIERVARCGHAKAFAVANTETLNCVFVHKGFNRGQDIEMFDLVDAALIRRIETADAFDFVAEEIEAKADFASGGKQVDNASTDRKFACVRHGIDTEIAVRLQQ